MALRSTRACAGAAAIALAALGFGVNPALAEETATPAPEAGTATTETPAETTEAGAPESEAPAADSEAAPAESTEAPAEESAEAGAAESTETAPAASDSSTVDLNIVAISDFHGHYENAAKLKTYVDEQRTNNPNTFFVADGDLVGGSAYISSIQNDAPTIDILNAMGLELSAAGNHEFDGGYNDFKGRIKEAAKWQYIVSNIGDQSAFAPYTILEKGGVKVAFVGGVTDELPTLTSPAGLAGLTITNPMEAVSKQAELLKDGNDKNGEADVVVAMIHETASKVKNVSDKVDAVVAGHTHQITLDQTPTGAPVVETGQYGRSVGNIVLTYDKNTKKVVKSDKKVDKFQVYEVNAECSPKVNDKGEKKVVQEGTEYADNAEIKALCAQYSQKAAELGKEVVGTIVGGADQAMNEGDRLGSHRGTESTASNMIADAFYEYSQGMATKADFGIMNPGGVRASLDPNYDGKVTKEESFTVQPFGNEYATLKITGAQVYKLLEQQWAHTTDENGNEVFKADASRPILTLGLSKNVRWTYSATTAVDEKGKLNYVPEEYGKHVKQVFINGALVPNDDSKTYVVTSNQFLLDGGDGFTVLSEGQDYFKTGMIDNDVFNEYLKAHPGYVVDYSQRSMMIKGEEALKAGEKATLDLASLSMTFGTKDQPIECEAVVLLDGVELAAAQLDTAITNDLNETGKATLDVTVPADTTAGTHTLAVKSCASQFVLPVNVASDVQPATDEPAAEKPVAEKSAKGGLAHTGADVAGIVGAALVLMLAGGAAVATRKRS